MIGEEMRDRFARVTSDLLDNDPDIALILADIGVSRFAASGVLKRHPNRVVNVGIREQLLISTAAGMAFEGFRPIAHSYAPFLVQRPYEQIKLDLGHQNLGAVLVSVGASYDAAGEGRTHQAPEDVSLLSGLPGWQVHVPGHPDEVEAGLRAAVAGEGPWYIRLAEDVNGSGHVAASGELTLVRAGSADAPLVVAVGPMLDRVMRATADLDVTVVYTSTVRPFDRVGLREAARSQAVVLVEPYLEGTSASEVTAALAAVPHRLLSVGVKKIENRHYGSRAEHDRAHGLDQRGLRERIRNFVST